MSHHPVDIYEKLRLSGTILRETREEIRHFVTEGIPIADVCERAESLIREKGAKPAFPCNVSINETAAHYTSPPGDESRIPQKSIVKVDIGAHVDGYVTDTAVTLCFNPELEGLVQTAEEALEKALEHITAGMPTSRLGAIIEKTIKERGFKPVSNLTGHSVGRYLVHAGTSLPNVSQLLSSKLKVGGIYAVEPFVTFSDAIGRVVNDEEKTIFRLVKSRSQKNEYAKRLLKYIEEEFKTLPFAERWLVNVVPNESYEEAFSQLLKTKAIMGYPVFVEVSGKPVAQAEHTVLLAEKTCEILT